MTGTAYLKNLPYGGFANFTMVIGVPGDSPVAGDWNNDGQSSPGIYRQGVFYLTNEVTNGTFTTDLSFAYGSPGDSPFIGNWQAFGSYDAPTLDAAVYRSSAGIGTFFLNSGNIPNSGTTSSFLYGLGMPTDIPIVGDWTYVSEMPKPNSGTVSHLALPNILVTPASPLPNSSGVSVPGDNRIGS